MEDLLSEIRSCTLCAQFLPNAPKPVLAARPDSRIAIIGQAPGQKVQNSGIPWDDASGKELRRWLGVSPEEFYNPAYFAILPMGFCFPGTGKSGDLPPRPECAPTWHPKLLASLPNLRLTLLIGQYAQNRYIGTESGMKVTDRVRRFREFLPTYLPLVHPSPRNKAWHKHNPWFEVEVVPLLQDTVRALLSE
jgi:uracil-DNA glycosylase